MSVSVTTFRVVEEFLTSLDSPRSLAVWLLFSNNEHDQMADMKCDPLHYINSEDFRTAYLATKFLSKSVFLSMKVDKKKVALTKFLEAEEQCRKVNLRGYHWTVIKQLSSEWLHHAIIRKIASILGDFNPEEMIDLANWGPGASLDVKGSDVSSAAKFRGELGTTRPLFDLMGDLYAVAYPSWTLPKMEIREGNKVVTVPKNSKTDRVIAIEPGYNIWFQLGVGKMIRRRLSRVSIDLRQQGRNQALSRVGSKYNNLATVDFSSASDTISASTVKELLPPRWYTVMDILRSRYGAVGGKTIRYEKFSSMGNGFTFELETLIFYAIAHAVCTLHGFDVGDISVYGDDVIIPSGAFIQYQKTCEFYGFTVNPSKSFFDGPFRESCGAHWFNGVNCKPFYLVEQVVGSLEKFKVANGIRRLSHFGDVYPHCDARFRPVVDFLIKSVNRPTFISDGYGDGAFIENFDRSSPQRAKHGVEGHYASSLVTTPLGYETDHPSLLLARLRNSSYEMGFGNKVHLRRRVRVSKKRLLIRRWYNLGPWL